MEGLVNNVADKVIRQDQDLNSNPAVEDKKTDEAVKDIESSETDRLLAIEDAKADEPLLLVNHVSHDGNNPYCASHAIFVSETAPEALSYEDEIPPALNRRILSLRAFDRDGMMIDAALCQPGEADPIVRRMLGNEAVDHVDAHTATRGCFMARAERA